MRIISIYAILCLLYCADLQAQSIRLSYFCKYKIPSYLKEVLPVEKINLYERSAKVTNWYYSLTICDAYSYWRLDSVKHPCDIRIQYNDRPKEFIQFDSTKSNEKYTRVKFDTSGQYYKLLYDEKYLLANKMEWDIDFTSQKIILGHKCFRAKHKYKSNLEVWFTPEIPTKYGPKELNGLPGLILEAHYITYDLYLININPSDQSMCNSLSPFNFKSVSQKSFNELLRKYEWSINAHDPCSSKKK